MELLAYNIWQILFNRPVSQTTTDEIWDHCSQCVNSAGRHDVVDAQYCLRSLPPTYDEVAPVAYQLALERSQNYNSYGKVLSFSTPAQQEEDWHFAWGIVWRGRNE